MIRYTIYLLFYYFTILAAKTIEKEIEQPQTPTPTTTTASYSFSFYPISSANSQNPDSFLHSLTNAWDKEEYQICFELLQQLTILIQVLYYFTD